jgi:hypothetical protein
VHSFFVARGSELGEVKEKLADLEMERALLAKFEAERREALL